MEFPHARLNCAFELEPPNVIMVAKHHDDPTRSISTGVDRIVWSRSHQVTQPTAMP